MKSRRGYELLSANVIAFAFGSGVESVHIVVCRTKATQAICSFVGWALGDSRLVVPLPTSRALFL